MSFFNLFFSGKRNDVKNKVKSLHENLKRKGKNKFFSQFSKECHSKVKKI